MSYEDYADEVRKALDRWADAVYNSSRRRARDLREDAEGLIVSWKENFPRRKKDIGAYVQYHVSRRFE